VYTLLGRAFPIGTIVVNCIGAFCIGLIMEFSLRSTLISPTLRVGITIGFLGGLTTFSTFSYETFRLLEDGNFLVATSNVLLSVVVCLTFTWLGIAAARYL
jgi:CrcB protein